MDKYRFAMDKIGIVEADHLLSHQVSGARYFFHDLAPSRKSPFSLVMGGCEQCDPDYFVSRRGFPFFGIEFVFSGRGSAILDSQRFALRHGMAFAYAPNTDCEIRTDPTDVLVKYFLNLSGTAAKRRLFASGISPGKAVFLPSHAEIRTILEDLLREGQQSGPVVTRICMTLLELLLLRIESGTAIAPRSQEPSLGSFPRCKSLIDAQAQTLNTLDEIARKAGVETSSVCRWFRRYQGTSPYQYLLRRKMNLAAEFLMENGGLVKAAASHVGFEDPYHFSRCFKTVHGIPPSALVGYRANTRPTNGTSDTLSNRTRAKIALKQEE